MQQQKKTRFSTISCIISWLKCRVCFVTPCNEIIVKFLTNIIYYLNFQSSQISTYILKHLSRWFSKIWTNMDRKFYNKFARILDAVQPAGCFCFFSLTNSSIIEIRIYKFTFQLINGIRIDYSNYVQVVKWWPDNVYIYVRRHFVLQKNSWHSMGTIEHNKKKVKFYEKSKTISNSSFRLKSTKL